MYDTPIRAGPNFPRRNYSAHFCTNRPVRKTIDVVW
jgi:hypothetical protein